LGSTVPGTKSPGTAIIFEVLDRNVMLSLARFFVILSLATCLLLPATHASQAAALQRGHSSVRQHAQPVAPVFHSVLRRLSRARIPVYLPSWLPTMKRAYAFATLYQDGKQFEVDLSYDPRGPGAGDVAFWMAADLVPLHISPTTEKVKIKHGRTVYIDPNPGYPEGMTIAWKQSGHIYVVGRGTSRSDLIRLVNSLVRVR
jgi:hypothetical protein